MKIAVNGAQLAGYADGFGARGLVNKKVPLRYNFDATKNRIAGAFGAFGFWIKMSGPADTTSGTTAFIANNLWASTSRTWTAVGNHLNFMLNGANFRFANSAAPANNFAIDKSKWYWVQIAASTTAFVVRVIIRNEDLTLVDDRYIGNSPGTLIPSSPFNLVNFGVSTAANRWGGSISCPVLLSCTTIDTAAEYPGQIIPPAPGVKNWYVDRDEYLAGNPQAIQSADEINHKLISLEICAGTGWLNESNTATPASGLTTLALHQAWADAYDAGNRRTNGDSIVFSPGRYEINNSIRTYSYPGVSLIGNNSVISSQRTLRAFYQPDATNYPLVWYAPGTGFVSEGAMGVVTEDGIVLQPVAHTTANIAAALTAIQATPGSCWADENGVYFSKVTNAFDLVDVRTNGKTYRCNVPQHGIIGLGIVELQDTVIRGISVESGPARMRFANTHWIQYAISMLTNSICVIDGCSVSYGSYHNVGMVGTDGYGLGYRKNVKYSRMCTIAANDSTDVTYTGYQSTGACIGSIFRGCVETEARIAPLATQGTNVAGILETVIWHGTGVSPAIFATEISNCDFGSLLNCGSMHLPSSLVIRDSKLQELSTATTGITVDRCLFKTPRLAVYAGSITISNSIFYHDPLYALSGHGSSTVFQGTVLLQRCTFDLIGFPFSTSGAACWGRSATLSLTLSSCAIIQDSNGAIIKNTTNADTLSVANCVFLNGASLAVFQNHNDGSTTANRTLAQLATLTIATSSISSASNGLLSYQNYAVATGSPVISAGLSASNVEDYTGVIFATRNDAGAREFV